MADAWPWPQRNFLIGPIEAFEYDYNVHLFKRIAPTAEWRGEREREPAGCGYYRASPSA